MTPRARLAVSLLTALLLSGVIGITFFVVLLILECP